MLGQFSVTFVCRPRAQHANGDGMSRQCGQRMRPGCPVSSPDSRVDDVDSTTALLDQPCASSEMGDSMDADLLPELSGETRVVVTYMDELKADLPSTGSGRDFVVASGCDLDHGMQVGPVRNLCGRSVWDYLRSCRSGICRWTRRGDYGIAGPLRRYPLSWYCRLRNVSFASSMTHLGVSRTT